MKHFSRYLLFVMVLLLVALGAALTTMRFAIHGREVAIPKLIGLKTNEARRVAESNGLAFQVEDHFYNNEIPEGRIVSQLPVPGSVVRRGWQVQVAESLGPQGATVPSVTGQSTRVAEIMIRRNGLDLGGVAVAHLPDLPPDQVVAQSPPANATNLPSPRVNLLMSSPSEPKAFVMPYLLGQRLGEVSDQITAAGLKLGNVRDLNHLATVPAAPSEAPAATTAPTPNAPTSAPPEAAGMLEPKPETEPLNPLAIVLRQSPSMGQRVTTNTPIDLEVATDFQSEAPEAAPPPVEPHP